MEPILEIVNLSIGFSENGLIQHVAEDISFTLYRGETTALVGESGSGKSVTALSILQLLPKQSVVTGKINYTSADCDVINLLERSSHEMRSIRGNKIAMIFQEPMTSLNPLYTCGDQVMEVLQLHKSLSKKAARQQTLDLFDLVELPDPSSMLNRYPHQISGGQKQRVMIAMAMSCQPDIIIADEPTTALDVRVQANILRLLTRLQQKTGMAILFITHDLGIVADFAHNVAVMNKGKVVEQGDTSAVLQKPQHPYTKALLACRPAAGAKGHRLALVSDFLSDTSSQTRHQVNSKVTESDEVLLSVKNLVVQFPVKTNFFGNPTSFFKAVDNVSFDIHKNEIVGLVGESGCGKTTLGRTILQLVEPTAGEIFLRGKNITHLSQAQLRKERKNLQIIFQDPYGSLNPRISVGSAISEALGVHNIATNKKQQQEIVVSLLEKVNLQADHFNRYPHQFSGGQRQRICIARALALNPSFLVFDESVSALDVSVQAQVLNLINELRESLRFTAIFISHDLSVVHYLSDRIMVMRAGKIVENGAADQVYNHPQNDYTRKLIDAIPGKRLA